MGRWSLGPAHPDYVPPKPWSQLWIACRICQSAARPHVANGLCGRCYDRQRAPRHTTMAEHEADLALLVTVPADRVYESAWHKRWEASRRPGLPSRVIRVVPDQSGLVTVARVVEEGVR